MSLEQFIADMRQQLHDLFEWSTPEARARAEMGRLRKVLARCSASLERLQKSIDELQTRVADKEQRASKLAARVEIFHHLGDKANAWQQALTLDQLRHFIHEEHRQLQEHSQGYRHMMARYRRLQEHLAKLRDRI
jgi:predicted  nucleic acid-binding Zn-ribbon protein